MVFYASIRASISDLQAVSGEDLRRNRRFKYNYGDSGLARMTTLGLGAGMLGDAMKGIWSLEAQTGGQDRGVVVGIEVREGDLLADAEREGQNVALSFWPTDQRYPT